MARLIEEIILQVGVDTKGLNEKLAKAGQGFEKLDDKVGDTGDTIKKKAIPAIKKTGVAIGDLDKKLNPHIKTVGKADKGWKKLSKSVGSGVAGFVAGGAAIAGLTARFNAMNLAVQDSERLGILTQDLVNLQGVGEQFGATAEDVTQGIKNINESASEAFVDKKGEKFDLFKELKIDLEAFNKLKPDKQLEEFGKSLNSVDNQGRRTAIALALMGEEGFKLTGTLKELARDADGAKAKVEGFVGSFDVEKIAETNKRLSEMKQRLQGVGNAAINLGLDAFDAVEEPISQIIFAMHGLNKAQEDYNDLLAAQEKQNKINFDAFKKRRDAELKANETRDERQRKHTERLAKLSKVIEDREGLGAGANQANKDFKRFQKEAQSREKIAKKIVDDKEKEAAAELKRIMKLGEAGQKVLDDERLTRKKALVERLRESGQGSLNFSLEAGSVQAQVLQQEVQGRDAGRLSQADQLEKEIKAEEKENNEKLLKAAEAQVTLLKSLDKKTSKNNVRGIRN